MSSPTRVATLRAVTKMSVAVSVCLVLAALGLAQSALAQEPTLKDVIVGKEEEEEQITKKPEQKKAEPAIPDDELNRGTPRSSVAGFLKAAGDWDYERAAEYLDLRNLPRGLDKSQGPRLARELKIVLDRTLWVDLNLLSTDPRGHADDGLPTYRDRLDRIETPKRTFNLLLQRVPRGDGVSIWKFSSTTVAQIPRLYARFGYGLAGDILPAVFLDLEILGLQAWWWVALVVVGFLAYLAALVITKVVLVFLHRTRTRLSPELERVITGPGRFLVFVVVARAGFDILGLPVTLRAVASAKTFLILAVAWTVMRLLDVFIHRLAERLRRTARAPVTVLLRPVSNALKIVIGIIAVIVWMDNIGFDVTTLLAGLGIGGLALALAAQKSIENLIGGITLYAAQPVRVGDFCRFGDKIGTVEEIGLRATRVRTLDHTVVSVPNAEFSNLHLDNFSKREKIWYHPRIRLRYETTPDQIRYILVEIRKMLYAHPKVLPDPARIRFEEFGTYSLDLNVFAYINVTDYGEFLEVAEDLNLRIMDIVAKAGSRLAVPSQTTYLERGNKLDDQLARAAEAEVNEWREQRALYLPSFPQEKIAELAGSVDYPPTGSPSAVVRG